MSESKPTTLLEPNRAKYQKTTSSTGKSSLNNGDIVAQSLAGATVDEVASVAAKLLGVTKKSLLEQYGHLNIGMQRMNMGNRIRGRVSALNDETAGSGDDALLQLATPVQEKVKGRANAA